MTSSSSTARPSGTPRLSAARSLAEPYSTASQEQCGHGSDRGGASSDSLQGSLVDSYDSGMSSSSSSRLDMLLQLVKDNSASRIERRAERQRRAEIALKATEHLKRQSLERSEIGHHRHQLKGGGSGWTVHDDAGGRQFIETSARGSSEEPRTRMAVSTPSRNNILQPTRSLPVVFEVSPMSMQHDPKSVAVGKSPEKRSSQQSWAGGVKPCGLRGGGGIPRVRSMGPCSPNGDTFANKRSRDGSEPVQVPPPRLHRPFKAPTMVAKRPSIQDQNAAATVPASVAFKKPEPIRQMDGVAAAQIPQRPPIQPLADRTRQLNSHTTSTSTSTSTLASTTGDPTDTGNDSFDDDDAADMEGLLMGGGEEVEALLRACDGA